MAQHYNPYDPERDPNLDLPDDPNYIWSPNPYLDNSVPDELPPYEQPPYELPQD